MVGLEIRKERIYYLCFQILSGKGETPKCTPPIIPTIADDELMYNYFRGTYILSLGMDPIRVQMVMRIRLAVLNYLRAVLHLTSRGHIGCPTRSVKRGIVYIYMGKVGVIVFLGNMYLHPLVARWLHRTFHLSYPLRT